MWTYSQKLGVLWDAAGNQVGHPGYSGHDEGLNNPDLQDRPNVGPIPRGRWTIHAPHTYPPHGPYVMALLPMEGTETFGRSGFLIHGDNSKLNESASEGCVIFGRTIREAIWMSGDHELEVVA